MSDPLDVMRQIRALERQLDQSRQKPGNLLSLPYAQRILNPFPLVSSGGIASDFAQSQALMILEFRVSVFVQTTNNGTNFWTLEVRDTAGTALASVTTAAISAGTWTRLSDTTITQPGSSNVALNVFATATLAPGNIFLVPEIIAVPG